MSKKEQGSTKRNDGKRCCKFLILYLKTNIVQQLLRALHTCKNQVHPMGATVCGWQLAVPWELHRQRKISIALLLTRTMLCQHSMLTLAQKQFCKTSQHANETYFMVICLNKHSKKRYGKRGKSKIIL